MKLERSKFRSWLETKKPSEVVGENRDCHGCPIAQFYLEASGGCEIVIFDRGDGYSIDRGYDIRPLPAWAQSFVCLVDEEQDGRITAGRALEILADARI